uniref:Uncharacterized protein n=1 Tax=Chromera velia CCMP2878 TaxID=1169474 RepID=A0A0G4IAA2_9ALVE|eukprot:Cvel_12405.t1-p1 / transcript=Cvel_12405.t1 / gene=Cvel_12405 / organism=Chromera_velia_CCMP2878 / gene_product=hypothetical protein / transcript_product=hypothetical protein / location=Cvel_scaffold811:37490-39491(+) / protein_length=542 / sequence_SO=supercontig / SO=protein_coding / is_pseudo=false
MSQGGAPYLRLERSSGEDGEEQSNQATWKVVAVIQPGTTPPTSSAASGPSSFSSLAGSSATVGQAQQQPAENVPPVQPVGGRYVPLDAVYGLKDGVRNHLDVLQSAVRTLDADSGYHERELQQRQEGRQRFPRRQHQRRHEPFPRGPSSSRGRPQGPASSSGTGRGRRSGDRREFGSSEVSAAFPPGPPPQIPSASVGRVGGRPPQGPPPTQHEFLTPGPSTYPSHTSPSFPSQTQHPYPSQTQPSYPSHAYPSFPSEAPPPYPSHAQPQPLPVPQAPSYPSNAPPPTERPWERERERGIPAEQWIGARPEGPVPLPHLGGHPQGPLQPADFPPREVVHQPDPYYAPPPHEGSRTVRHAPLVRHPHVFPPSHPPPPYFSSPAYPREEPFHPPPAAPAATRRDELIRPAPPPGFASHPDHTTGWEREREMAAEEPQPPVVYGEMLDAPAPPLHEHQQPYPYAESHRHPFSLTEIQQSMRPLDPPPAPAPAPAYSSTSFGGPYGTFGGPDSPPPDRDPTEDTRIHRERERDWGLYPPPPQPFPG